MAKTIFITGSTDGIGLGTAKALSGEGHKVILHGRNAEKLTRVKAEIEEAGGGRVEGYVADLSVMAEVKKLADAVLAENDSLDVLINNAGILKSPNPKTVDGLDVRFAVNTIAPFILTQALLPLLGGQGRVVNLSSAAQASVDVHAMEGSDGTMEAMDAYSQSKLAITMWTIAEAERAGENTPSFIAVNPGSLLASNMVKEGFGIAGNDINIGVDILMRTSLSDEFAGASGKYWDNDAKRFANPHPDALDAGLRNQVVEAIKAIASRF